MNGPSTRRLAVVAVATFVVLSLSTGVGAFHDGPFPQQSAIDPDGVLLAIDLAADGSAVWRIEYRVRLDDANTTEAFESVRADIRAEPGAFTGPFADRMGTTVAVAENATGREMTLQNVSVAAETRQLPQLYGVVTYRFEWTGFAAVDGPRLRAGDAIDGLFLDGETRLLVSWPDGYRLVEATPAPRDQRETSAAWAGPLDFADGEPRFVVTSAAATPASVTADGETAASGRSENGSEDGTTGRDLPWSALGVVFVVLLATAGWFLYARRDRSTEAENGPLEELLSNEERVLRLLEDHGGRMKQQEVAEALGWTDARTSQVIGQLREEDKLESFRLGRENVLSLPHDDDT